MPLRKLIKKSVRFLNDATKTFQAVQEKVNALKEKAKEKEKIFETVEKHSPQKNQNYPEKIIVDLSVRSVSKSTFTVIGIVVLVYFLYLIKSILLIFFVSLFLASVFNPGVDFLEKYKIPRSVGLIIFYLLVLALLVFFVVSLVPIIIEQVNEIANNLGIYINTLFNGESLNLPFSEKWMPLLNDLWSSVDRQQIISTLQSALKTTVSKLGDMTGNILGVIVSISAGVLNMIMVLFITFFIVIDKKNLQTFFLSLFPSRHGDYLSSKIHVIQGKIGDWIRGQMLLSLVMGLITFIAFKLIGLKYATTLALVAGISEFIPYIGPIITFSSAALIAVNQSFTTFLWLIPAYVMTQTIEGNIMVPLIMSRSVGINPIIVIIAMLVGWQFLGILGMIIAIPLAKIISIFVEDYRGRVK